MSTYNQYTYTIHPTPVYSTLEYMSNNNDDSDDLFAIDDVDTEIYSTSLQSIPSLVIDNSSLSDDDDLDFDFDSNTESNSTSFPENDLFITDLETLPTKLNKKRPSLQFNSVLINNSIPQSINASVAEQNYKIWLSHN